MEIKNENVIVAKSKGMKMNKESKIRKKGKRRTETKFMQRCWTMKLTNLL